MGNNFKKNKPQNNIETKTDGVFLGKRDEEDLRSKYGISNKTIYSLIEEFGSLDNYRNAYIQYKIDLANARTDEERERIFNQNHEILKYRSKLPLVENFYLTDKENYIRLLDVIFKDERSENLESIVIDDSIEYTIKIILDKLEEKERNYIELRFGLNDGQTRTPKEMSVIFKMTETRIKAFEEKIIREFKNYKNMPIITEDIYISSEEFIRAYFEVHDIFYGKNEPQMDRNDINRLVKIYRTEFDREKRYELNREIEKIGLSDKICSKLKSKGIRTVSDLLNRGETKDEFVKFTKGFGRQAVKDLISAVHGLGFYFQCEKEIAITNCDNEYKELCEKVEKLNQRKERVLKNVNRTVKHLNEMCDGRETLEITRKMEEGCQMLQEQNELLKELDKEIEEIRKLEIANRNEREKLIEKFSGRIQGLN